MFFLVKAYSPSRPGTPRVNRPFEEIDAEKKKRRKPAVSLANGKFKLKSIVIYPVIAGVVALFLALAGIYQRNMALSDIQVKIEADSDNQFLNAEDITKVLTDNGERKVIGEKMSVLDLKELEAIIRSNPTIEQAEIFKSIQGALHIEAKLRKPVARLINNDGSTVYMDETGHKFPDSYRHAANVVLVRGDFNEAVVDTFECATILSALPVLTYIQQDTFWNAQISEVEIQQSGELVLYPQVGDMYVEFGQPVRIEEKFHNLKDFYRQVVREVGMDKYRYVSVEFRGQVVAKRKRS
ncbi:MAG: cell division protein FtsQ/DivIB [Bacteroidia bacterium]